MKLYEINKAYKDVIETGFSIDEETGEILFDAESLDALNETFENKVDNIACVIKEKEALDKAIADEIKALQERRKQCQKQVDYLKEYITSGMQLREMNALETARNKISFRKSTSVNVLDEAKIPSDYFVQKIENKLDKKSILADLKKGVEIEGCELQEKNNLQLK